MGHGLLAYLNPAKALTAFSCWWLQIDAGVARKLRAEARGQCEATVVQNGPTCKQDAIVKVIANCASQDRLHFTLPPPEHDQYAATLQPRLYAWDFDMFSVAEESGGRPLYTIVMALLQDFDLLDGWKLCRPTVMRFLAAVESQYHAGNPYHNNTHAADVTQTVAVIIRSLLRLLPDLSKLELFTVIISAAVHDLAHPGVNNDFLINSGADMSVVYNDRSVNENMHACRAFQIAFSSDELNIFSVFSREEFKRVRQLIVAMVLSTDMAVHFDLLEKFNREIAAEPCLARWKDRSLLFQMAVHLADLANPSRPFPLAKRWAQGVVKEFLEQGDREAALGLPVSPMCNKQLVSMPKSQLGFINLFLRPTLAGWTAACPEFGNMATCQLDDTVRRWGQMLEEEGSAAVR